MSDRRDVLRRTLASSLGWEPTDVLVDRLVGAVEAVYGGALVFRHGELANLVQVLDSLRVCGGQLVASADGVDMNLLGDTIAAAQIELDRVADRRRAA